MSLLNESQIRQIIGNLEASIEKIEAHLSPEDFQGYCDSTYTAITHWRLLLKKVKEEQDVED